MARAAILNNLDLPDDYDVLSVDLDEDASDAICSISEGEGVNTLMHVKHALDNLPTEDYIFMMKEADHGWRCAVRLTDEQEKCFHTWEHNRPIQGPYIRCTYCHIATNV